MDQEKIQKIEKREITDELREAYLDYAMSVIVSRALPDIRDGLKPVQRRILWTMYDDGLTYNAKFRKSANVVGSVLGRYHPHGDIAVYDALARMAQDFSLRYPLISGQGNWGSVDGDSPAAMRYTECRLSKIAEELLVDIEKDTVDWQANYDSTRQEPKILPAKLPNLLLNGAMGIAVGMATNIPPHNLSEVVDAIICLIENPDASTEDLMQYIKGPDFPTGGIIYNRKAIINAYISGRGPITCRAVSSIEERKAGQFNIVITEIPYQVNKSELLSHIADLVTEKKIEGIRDLRDESDREGMRIVIELKNEVAPQKVLNQLYKHTDLQKDFHLNMIALVDGIQPQLLSLKEVLVAYIEHRKIVVERRTKFDLERAKERAHILEGLVKALGVIDRIIATIKKSQDREDARLNLMKIFRLTEIQANAILDMKLQALAALEQKKIDDELKEKKKLIIELTDLLKSPKKILGVVRDELVLIKNSYGDERRTKVVESGLKEFREEDLVSNEEVVIILTESGYIKRLPPTVFRAQKRGGKGLIGQEMKDEDFIKNFVSANTHDNILFFTDQGRVFQTKVYEIPTGSRISKGKLVQNFLEIPGGENITAVISYSAALQKSNIFLIMATKEGLIKKTALKDFSNVRRSGLRAINLKQGDQLRWVRLSSGRDEVILVTIAGQAIRFKETELRPLGRVASGVRAMRLKNGDFIAGLDIIKKENNSDINKLELLVVTQNGFAKRTPLAQYKLQGRGGSGIKTAKISNKTGQIVAAQLIIDEEEILALSVKGQVIRTKIADIRRAGRATAGVKIMRLSDGDKIAGIVCL